MNIVEKTSKIIIFFIATIISISILNSYSIFAYATTSENYSFVKEWGTQGIGDGQFNRPSAIAIDPSSNNVYIVDSGNNRIQVFDLDGKFISKWGTQGSGDGQFNGPTDIAIDPVGNVYVLDSGNSKIEKFTSDGSFLTKWAASDVTSGPVYQSGISIDASGNVYYTKTTTNKFRDRYHRWFSAYCVWIKWVRQWAIQCPDRHCS